MDAPGPSRSWRLGEPPPRVRPLDRRPRGAPDAYRRVPTPALRRRHALVHDDIRARLRDHLAADARARAGGRDRRARRARRAPGTHPGPGPRRGAGEDRPRGETWPGGGVLVPALLRLGRRDAALPRPARGDLA